MDLSDKLMPILFVFLGIVSVIRSKDFYCPKDTSKDENNYKYFWLFLTAGVLFILGGVISWFF